MYKSQYWRCVHYATKNNCYFVCGNSDPRTCDVVKRTCGYLGNPQARPMVKGRHKEISARVKHMNGSTM